MIARHYEKPISYFFLLGVSVDKNDYYPLEEELLFMFRQLPESQQNITLEYVNQPVKILNRAYDRKLADEFAKYENQDDIEN